MFFLDGIFTTNFLADPRTITVLQDAVEYARETVCPGDILRAILTSDEERVHTILEKSVKMV